MPGQELNPRTILTDLGWAEGVTAIEPVTGGQDTAIWRVEQGKRARALRLFRSEQTTSCQREAGILRAVLPGVPVPALIAAGLWRGRSALLIEWCEGQTLAAALQTTPPRLPALGRAFGQVHARLHAAPVPRELLDAPPWYEWQQGGTNELHEQLREADERAPAILHLDYHPLNVLVHQGAISAVLDWTNVRVGDRRADLARTATIFRLMPLPTAQKFFLRLLDLFWRRGYRDVAGPIAGMAPFYAWAGVAMLNDLGPRAARGQGGLATSDLAPVRRWTEHWRARASATGSRAAN